MPMRFHRKIIAGIGTLAAAGAFAAATAPADAAGPTQCVDAKKLNDPLASHHYCPLNKSANIPVYATPSLKRRVGTLNRGGLANWFLFQVQGQRVKVGGFTNEWWAYTQADTPRGREGYVPEVYFRGGGVSTDDPANGLPINSIRQSPSVSVPSGPRP
jgi:hypothetical protein